MSDKFLMYLGIMLLIISSQTVNAAGKSTQAELDAFWLEVARTVTEGDFEAYKSTYHEDAILVSEASDTTHLISTAFAKWEKGFLETRNGDVKAHLEFRITQRMNDDTTAHEKGIFKYSAHPLEGESSTSYVHFEALLIKQGTWKTLMEYQKSPATNTEWDAAK